MLVRVSREVGTTLILRCVTEERGAGCTASRAQNPLTDNSRSPEDMLADLFIHARARHHGEIVALASQRYPDYSPPVRISAVFKQ